VQLQFKRDTHCRFNELLGVFWCLPIRKSSYQPYTGTAWLLRAHTYERIDIKGIFHTEWND
jgi:hypothetical protein